MKGKTALAVYALVVLVELGILVSVAVIGSRSGLWDLDLGVTILILATLATGSLLWWKRAEQLAWRGRGSPDPLDRWHQDPVRPHVLRRALPWFLVFGAVGVGVGYVLPSGGMPWPAMSTLVGVYFGGFAAYEVVMYGSYVRVFKHEAWHREWSRANVLLAEEIREISVVEDSKTRRVYPAIRLAGQGSIELTNYWSSARAYASNPSSTLAGHVQSLLSGMSGAAARR